MPGRGIDQILPKPCDPLIYESYIRSAADYVQLAERRFGRIPKPVDPGYIWGSLPDDLDSRDCDLRIVNLETAITCRGQHAPKGINYRMSPDNASVLKAARIDACTLANNHVLDWGETGLIDTLSVLDRLDVKRAGVGRTKEEAATPAALGQSTKGRVLLLAFGHGSAGVPREWKAASDRPGIAILPDNPEEAAALVRARTAPVRRSNDIVVVSVHWGGNWGYTIPHWQKRMAHALIDAAKVDLVFGHSSHHPKGIEIYHDRLILYGCGDLINDYEGIGGHEAYHPDLGLAFVIDIDTNTGRLSGVEIIPYIRRAFSLARPDEGTIQWLVDMLMRESHLMGWRMQRSDGSIHMQRVIQI